ncbi:M1 family metallopeptidase [Aeromicrobium sp. A1-2]|uniref:M1 family metallopeptidase n=1 Tax=Aeromicrobium sp. A1-2 TaxID=2107713 RepID=UPI0020B148AA|nr:M1 family metallopeptidase [Aeromicrobium sp. A1-2]
MKPSLAATTSSDPYVPGHGDLSFDVDHYLLELEYNVESNRLAGRATLTATARQDLDRFELDLYHLRVSKVTVDGAAPAKHAHQKNRLIIRPRSPIATGDSFTVSVAYAGSPRPMPGPDGDAGWEELADGVIVASQPHGAPSWFPCNDRPSDKATYEIETTTPSSYVVVANGVLESRRRRAGSTVWRHVETSPMATYLATIQIGRYEQAETDTAIPIRTVYPAGAGEVTIEMFARQAEMMALFVRRFGPYPFEAYTAVITEDELEIPLEAQGLSVFGSNFATSAWEHQRLIAHELAHQWFGNSLTLGHWRDIWLHEGFACYAEWLWSEESGGPTAHDQADRHWHLLEELPQDLVLGDPGPDLMFDDRLYKRGALLLHALRRTVGDDAFFQLLQAWTTRYAKGTVTTEQFVALAAERCGASVGELFDRWLRDVRLPELPAS